MKKIFKFIWQLFFPAKKETSKNVEIVNSKLPETIIVSDPEILSGGAKQPERVETMSRSQIRQILFDDGIIYLSAYDKPNINQIRKTVFFMRKKYVVLFNNKLRAYIYKGLRTKQ